MIAVTKEEACLLRELYPDCTVARTMRQDSKRHHYFATESEGMMRAIAKTNETAAALVAEFDRAKELKNKRREAQGGQENG